jgi:hypothetical protein
MLNIQEITLRVLRITSMIWFDAPQNSYARVTVVYTSYPCWLLSVTYCVLFNPFTYVLHIPYYYMVQICDERVHGMHSRERRCLRCLEQRYLRAQLGLTRVGRVTTTRVAACLAAGTTSPWTNSLRGRGRV